MAVKGLKAKIVFEDHLGREIDLSGDVHSIDVTQSPAVDMSHFGGALAGKSYIVGHPKCEFTISGRVTNLVMDKVLELFRAGKYHLVKEDDNVG